VIGRTGFLPLRDRPQTWVKPTTHRQDALGIDESVKMARLFKGRRKDFRLLTGRGHYTADWRLPGQAHGVFLRSERADAEIVA